MEITKDMLYKESLEFRNTKTSRRYTFPVHPTSKYSFGDSYYRKPVEFGNFSLDGSRAYHDDARQLRYYVPPLNGQFRFNLREGYDNHVKAKEDVNERLTHLLIWIKKHRELFKSKEDKDNHAKRLNTDFISWRGHLTKFLTTPYERRDPWKMAASLFNGTIYISEIKLPEREIFNQNPLYPEMCYWGYKFESYVTESANEKESDEESLSVVNCNEAYCSVVRTKLSNNSILLGAEVDCCEKSHGGKPPNNYIELKTTRHMDSFKQKENFKRYKLLKFWAQSFLSGLPRIIVGIRDDNGIVTSLKEYETLNIPMSCDEGVMKWDAKLCINFLNSLLEWLKQLVVIDNPYIAYVISYDEPFDEIVMEVIDDGSERFLPAWFTDE